MTTTEIILVALPITLGAIGLILHAWPRERFVSIEWIDKYEAIIETTKATYRGEVTVWHNAKTGARAGTNREVWLNQIYTAESWKREKEQA